MEPEPNEALHRLRISRGWTQAQVADKARAWLRQQNGRSYAFDANRVSKYEKGKVNWPDRHYRDALAAIFDTDPDQLGFYSTRTRRDAQKEVFATHRREFLILPAAAAVPVLFAPEAPARTGRKEVTAFEQRISSLAKLQRMAGGGATRALCTPEIYRAIAVARHTSMTPAIRTAWYRGIGRLAGTACWAAFDDAAEDEALELLEAGRFAAEESGDAGLVAFLAEVGARLHVQMHRPAKALAELRRATGPVPPGIAAACAALAARALALTGDARGVTREITAADAAFTRLDHDTSTLAGYANAGKHAADCGDAFFDLSIRADAPQAELTRRLSTSLDLLPADRARTRAVAAAKLASIMFRTNDREQGDQWMIQARGAAAGVQSSRMRLVLRDMEHDRAQLG